MLTSHRLPSRLRRISCRYPELEGERSFVRQSAARGEVDLVAGMRMVSEAAGTVEREVAIQRC